MNTLALEANGLTVRFDCEPLSWDFEEGIRFVEGIQLLVPQTVETGIALVLTLRATLPALCAVHLVWLRVWG
ncbi:hypothetical protein LTS10_007159 [Elasticomyces elasticus]|nr:hypothetical protein LTS10_007159 [Elasticomyces elasticus]